MSNVYLKRRGHREGGGVRHVSDRKLGLAGSPSSPTVEDASARRVGVVTITSGMMLLGWFGVEQRRASARRSGGLAPTTSDRMGPNR
jgi:hypothetical protein